MVNFPTWIPDCDCHSPALLDLFISSDASVCSTVVFAPLGYSDHVVFSVFHWLSVKLKSDALFHFIAHDYPLVD